MLDPHNVAGNLISTIHRANKGLAPSDPLFLPNFSIHDLRHLHASCLIHDGWSIPLIARRLGHADPAITMSTYAHIIEAMDVGREEMMTPASLTFTGSE